MVDFSVVFDPMLDKERAEFDNGSGGSGGSSYVGGERINIAGGTISFVNSADIVNVTGTSVTLQPNTAYKIYATSQAITLNANPPAAGKWAYEGHLEIFTAGTGYVVTGTNVVLANALEPDSVNNCTVRFHDGIAIIAVEDHVAGYIVVNGATSGSGSLYYGIATSTNDYVAFDASLNGTTIPLAGAVSEGEKHVVGNGYTSTTLTGAVDCGTSKFTIANLALQNVQVTGGTMTLGDAFIPSSSTVAVSGGGLAIEKVSGNGGVIDLGGTNVFVGYGTTASASGCTFIGGSGTSRGGAIYGYGGNFTLTSCTVSGNSAPIGGGIDVHQGGSAYLVDCVVSGNNSVNGDIFLAASVIDVNGGLYGQIVLESGSAIVSNNVRVGSIRKFSLPGTVTLTSGAIVDLTGNTNATPIAPGGDVTFESGGATVKVGDSTASSSYMMDNVTLPAGAKLTNTAVVNLGGARVDIPWGYEAMASGCTFSGSTVGTAIYGNRSNTLIFEDCTFTENTVQYGVILANNTTMQMTDCVVSGNTGPGVWIQGMDGGSSTLLISGGSYANNVRIYGANDIATLVGNIDMSYVYGSGSCVISSGASINLTSSIEPGGGITVLTGGCTVNGNAIPAGTYTSIDSTGQPT